LAILFAEGFHRWSHYNAKAEVDRRTLWANSVDYSVEDYVYDVNGRLKCGITYMDPAQWGPYASACSPLQTNGPNGPDRVRMLSYDPAGNVAKVEEGVGTSAQAAERSLTYTNNGKLLTLKDAKNNLTTYEYGNLDRLGKIYYPNPNTPGVSSTTDFESFSYDPNGNLQIHGLRDGTSITSTYDELNRVKLKNLPASELDVTYTYDNLGHLKSASQTGSSFTFTYDALGRLTDETGPRGTVHSDYNLDGTRSKVTYADAGLSVNYDYLTTGDISKIRENNATTGVGLLATYAYDNLGNGSSVTFGNGVSQAYGYDPVSRLTSMTTNLPGTPNYNVLGTLTYNPASEIASAPRSNDALSFPSYPVGVSATYTSNGLNQYTVAASKNYTYDLRGNLTSDGTHSYCFSSENLLTSSDGTCASPTVTLGYDPLTRLSKVVGTSTTQFGYDGLNMLAEYDGSNALQRRYVFAPGIDEPIVWYDGTGTSNRQFLSTDERGSIVTLTDSSGAVTATNSYDEYGIPATSGSLVTNSGRFQYTGQAYIPELGLYYYKARFYSPSLGRFMQTDPISYADNANLYAYVGNNPTNGVDPLGLNSDKAIVIQAKRWTFGEDLDQDPRGTVFTGQDRIPSLESLRLEAKTYPGHFYKRYKKVSKGECNLTDAESAYLAQHFATPFAPGQAAVNGRVDLFGILSPNPIAQRITNGGQSVINTTLPGHILHSDQGGGQVVRSVITGDDGAAYSSTIGYGTNYNSFIGGFNVIGGYIIFDDLDDAMSDYIDESGICK
jgi:RHS repeat-associated protein